MLRSGSIVLALACLVAASFLPGCSSGGGGGVLPGSVSGMLTTSSTPAAADLVRILDGGVSGDMVTIGVAISGPTTSADIYSFAFDLVLSDTLVARFLSNSEVIGTALTPGVGQSLFVEAAPSGNRVVVGVTKTGAGAGNAIPASEELIVRLTFQVLRAGTSEISFAGQPGMPSSAPAVLDSAGVPIAGITFDSVPVLITGVP